MKKFLLYFVLMLAVVVLLPLFIVKGCQLEKPVDKQNNNEHISQLQKESKNTNKFTNKFNLEVFFHEDNNISQMPIEEYLYGVVAAEMPGEFEVEALKAQAITSRTYAYYRILNKIDDEYHSDANVCTDSTHCQAWISKEKIMERWEEDAESYWQKILEAVTQTENIVITYDGEIANPVYHANSGGQTENAEEVWAGVVVPYLKSVKSSGDEISSSYKTSVVINSAQLYDTIKKEYPQLEIKKQDIINNIEIGERTEGGSVKDVSIGNILIKGTVFRTMLSLNSANFYIESIDDSAIHLTVYGHGHGVGMSQWGANAMAKEGSDCSEILKHYYTGVGLSKIKH